MKKTDKAPETLKEALAELARLAKAIQALERQIDDSWGVHMWISSVCPNDRSHPSVFLTRGIEAISEALGKDAKNEYAFSYDVKLLRLNGIEYRQYADKKTGVFVKAFKEPPKFTIVEE